MTRWDSALEETWKLALSTTWGRGRRWREEATSRGASRIGRKAQRGRERFFPRAFRGSTALPPAWSQAPDVRTTRLEMCYLKPFRWWFVLATLGNWEHWCQQVVCCCNKYLRLETQRWGRVEAGRLLRCALEKATNAGGTDKGDARKSSENGELEWQLFREHINNHQQAMGDKGLLPTPDKKWGTCFGQWRKSDCYKVAKNLSSVLWKTEGTNERDS